MHVLLTTNKDECKFYCIELRRRRPRSSSTDIRVFHKLKLVCVVSFHDRIHELCFDINLYSFTGSVNL